MALNLNQLAQQTTAEEMYDISINGVSFGKLTESNTSKLIGYLKNLQSGNSVVEYAPTQQTTQSAPQPEQKTEDRKLNTAKTTGISDVKCKWAVDELVMANGKKFYHLADGIFTAGKWMQSKFDKDEIVRFPVNQEAHKLANDAVKKLDGIQSLKLPSGAILYGYTTKKTAETAISKLPEKISKVAIADWQIAHPNFKVTPVVKKKWEVPSWKEG